MAALLPLSDLPNVSADAILADIGKLASDEFEGRAPGSNGETLTVQYLSEQFQKAGLDPGNPDGTWVQKVPLVGLTPTLTSLEVGKDGAKKAFKAGTDFVAFSKHVVDEVKLEGSELVFVGYGVQAPEFNWDDFKGLDVKGKTIIVLVNDPPVPDPNNAQELDAKTFGGKAMTYYGRWTYKYDKGAELGAAAVLVVHETYPAGYPWAVVQSNLAERFNLAAPDKNQGRSKIEGWLTLDAATELLKMAGQDYQKLKAQALTPGFQPVSLGLTASLGLKQAMRTVDSQNVIGKLPGGDPVLKDEYVIYTAHWDHFGRCAEVDGDDICNGALDNASGTAVMLEIARKMKTVKPAPRRSILFLSVTAEEQGLLGSEYYAAHPLYPLEKTLGVVNIDGINQWGKTSDLVVVGLGASDLDDYAAAAAKEQNRTLKPDAEPEKGFYYRSDHFNFAKKGVPAFDPGSGVDYIGKPADYSQKKRDEYTSNDYHKPSDQIKADWDLSGAVDDARLFLAIGYRVAQAEKYPQWKTGNEFRSIREAALAGKK